MMFSMSHDKAEQKRAWDEAEIKWDQWITCNAAEQAKSARTP
jgi:hypothetical protein